jgi:hypothetical protein
MSENKSGLTVVTHESGWVLIAVVYRIVDSTIYSFVTGRSTSLKEHQVDGSYTARTLTRPICVPEYGKVKTHSFDDRIPHAVWRGSLACWESFYRLGNHVFDDDEERSTPFSEMMRHTPEEARLLIDLPYQLQGLIGYGNDGEWLMHPSLPSNPQVVKSSGYYQYFSRNADQRVLRLCTLYSEVDYHWT